MLPPPPPAAAAAPARRALLQNVLLQFDLGNDNSDCPGFDVGEGFQLTPADCATACLNYGTSCGGFIYYYPAVLAYPYCYVKAPGVTYSGRFVQNMSCFIRIFPPPAPPAPSPAPPAPPPSPFFGFVQISVDMDCQGNDLGPGFYVADVTACAQVRQTARSRRCCCGCSAA